MATLIVISSFLAGASAADVPGLSAEAVTAIVMDVADGTRHFDESALYLLLDQCRSGVGPADEVANAPAMLGPGDLIAESAALRGMRVTIAGRFVQSERVRLSNRRRYADPVHVTLLAAPDTGDPLQVVTTLPPPAVSVGTPLRATGYYFKYRRGESRREAGEDGARDVLVPIVVSRQLTLGPGIRPTAKGDWARAERIGLVVLALGLVYYGARRLARRTAQRGRRDRVRSRAATEEPAGHRRPIDLDAFGQNPSNDANKPSGE